MALKKVGASPSAVRVFQEYKTLEVALKNKHAQNMALIYKMKIANTLKGFSLYYHNEFDYRSRFYTSE